MEQVKKVPNPQRWWGTPMIKHCRPCDNKYEYYRSGDYPGKSASLCPGCQRAYKERGSNMSFDSNANLRSGGHKTRQQHKKVRPTQL